ncbi:hypothetical protein BJ508DRAFT_412078 [Ascobolus immersus RN42]|uniref:N-acetyltransferase domain-containing protein n=1 Tax=Ascobolus immersus RN42 TaxID=1160509 RepID=A0A3N4IGM0_ASCIM|nr:hypothetical protein BJ508DRAFT_412078 [Ascobolus immersus RN42]
MAAYLISTHFYQAGARLQSENNGLGLPQKEYWTFLQETPREAPWLYREQEVSASSDTSIPVTAWMFLLDPPPLVEGPETSTNNSEPSLSTDFVSLMIRGINDLKLQLSHQHFAKPCTITFSINFPIVQSALDSTQSLELRQESLAHLFVNSLKPALSFVEPVVVNRYRVLHQRISFTNALQTDLDPNISIRIISPTGKVPSSSLLYAEDIPSEMRSIRPSLAARGEVVIGIYVSSVLAGYISILGRDLSSPFESNPHTGIPDNSKGPSQEHISLYISLLYINKRFRRMGLGRKLLEFVLHGSRVNELVKLAHMAVSGTHIDQVDREERVGEDRGADKGKRGAEEPVELAGVDVWVTVDAEKRGAGALYESVGFVEVGCNGSVGFKI